MNATDIGNESTMSAEIRARLEDYYETPNRELTELLGNEFKVW